MFAPAPSPDGGRVAAIEFGPDLRCHLVLLETASGAEQARFSAPAGVFWRTPAWSEDGRHIAVVRQDERGNTLERIDAGDGQGEIVLPHTHADIGWPVFWGSYLLFDAPYSGIDNIHAVHLPSGARYQVTSRPLAATHAAVAGDSLLFQEYTVDGYRIAAMHLDPAAWTPVEQVADRQVRYYETADRPGAGRSGAGGHPTAGLSGEQPIGRWAISSRSIAGPSVPCRRTMPSISPPAICSASAARARESNTTATRAPSASWAISAWRRGTPFSASAGAGASGREST